MSFRYSHLKSLIQFFREQSKESRQAYMAILTAKTFIHPMFPRKVKSKRRMRWGFDFEEMLNAVGIEDAEEVDALDVKRLMTLIHKRYGKLYQYDKSLTVKAEKLCRFFNLPPKSSRLIVYCHIVKQESAYQNLLDAFGEVDRKTVFKFLATLLDAPSKTIKQLFHRTSPLQMAKMLELVEGNNEIYRRLDISSQLTDYLSDEDQSIEDLLQKYFRQTSKPLNTLSDFEHLSEHQEFLMSALAQKKFKPLNILIYGEPGSGKTEWVKALASSLNKPLYQVASEDEDGDPIIGSQRLGAFKVADIALSKSKTTHRPMVLFDEIEDIFPKQEFLGFSMRDRRTPEKAHLNELLENTQITSFWLSNSVNQIDPAFVRRFDLVIEMKAPPKAQRKKIITQTMGELTVSDVWLDELANFKQVTPGVLKTAAGLVTHNQIQSIKEVEAHLERLLNQLLKAQGHSPIRFKQKMGGLAYDLSLINADSDLSGLISGMQTMQQGRVCLYGIPGTGKTAFGKHLAEQLDKAFIHKKPSDILSPYVGMMEKNLATAFEEAELENGVLQIDEVDSFLANRSHAERSWEVSQVNEMLAQLENYQGIIIVTTNRLKDMDEAVLRRFDLKIELKPLTNEQAWSFLQNVLTEKADNELDVQARLNRLSPLTPGDFYAAKRGLTLSGKAMNAENWLTALEGEVSVKPQYHKSQGIGFTSHLSA